MKNLQVKIYADGADKDGMIKLYQDPTISGLTTNPTLMRKAGISDYEAFAKDILTIIKTKPISLEVFSDEFAEMKRQALKLASWQSNVYVKIPITNSKGESSQGLIKELAAEGVQLNITAILTLEQVHDTVLSLSADIPSVISIFAGRIADTGIDPDGIMRKAKKAMGGLPKSELLWASVREVLNIFQADEAGCDIVTVPHDILKKASSLVGKNLSELSLDTVKMFKQDAETAGYIL